MNHDRTPDFIRASKLYDVRTGARITHPAAEATDDDVAAAVGGR